MQDRIARYAIDLKDINQNVPNRRLLSTVTTTWPADRRSVDEAIDSLRLPSVNAFCTLPVLLAKLLESQVEIFCLQRVVMLGASACFRMPTDSSLERSPFEDRPLFLTASPDRRARCRKLV